MIGEAAEVAVQVREQVDAGRDEQDRADDPLSGDQLQQATAARRIAAFGHAAILRGSPAAHPQHLGDRPRLERAARRRVRGGAVGRLGDRAEPPVGEVRLDPGECAVRVESPRCRPRRGRARAATARRFPGGRPRRARRGRRDGRAGSARPRARASAARAGSGASRGKPRRRLSPRRRRAARRGATRRGAGSAAPRRRRRRGRRPRRAGRGRRRERSARRTRPPPARGASRTGRRSVLPALSSLRHGERPQPERVHLDRLPGAWASPGRRRSWRPST